MIHLNFKTLSAAAQAELTRQQKVINQQTGFDAQVAKAQARWKSKERSKAGKTAFAEIRQEIRRATVSEQACSYCEYSEGEDVEHIYPKSWFPERTFSWDNYLLACKSCNTSFKSNNFAVFNPAGSATVLELDSQVIGPSPSVDGLLLNPRAENPLNYLDLDFFAGCAFEPALNLNQRDQHRAIYTIRLLQLNLRSELRKARQTAHKQFIGLLREYVEAKQATTLPMLVAAVNEPNVVDSAKPLVGQRARIMASLRRTIRTQPHPSVWQELQRQHLTMTQATRLFKAAPEALTW